MYEPLLVIKVDNTLFLMGFVLRVFNPILSKEKYWRRVSFNIFTLSMYPEVRIFQLWSLWS